MTGAAGTHRFDTVATEQVFDGAILRLRVDTVEMPGGGTARREVVDHLDAVAVVAVDEDRRVVLLRQYRHPVGMRLLELPAGLCDVDGESMQATAARELVEEAGLRAEHWRELVRITPSPGFSTEWVQIYLATGLQPVDRPQAQHEEADIEQLRMPLDEAVRAVMDGRIANGIAVSGILAAAQHLGSC